MKFILIVGLPGSGKSFFAEKLMLWTKYIIIDDPRTVADIDKLYNKYDYIIVDPSLCIEYNRNRAINLLKTKYGEDITIDFIYFENDPVQCLKNSRRRHKVVANYIRELSENYTIPAGATILKVWRP